MTFIFQKRSRGHAPRHGLRLWRSQVVTLNMFITSVSPHFFLANDAHAHNWTILPKVNYILWQDLSKRLKFVSNAIHVDISYIQLFPCGIYIWILNSCKNTIVFQWLIDSYGHVVLTPHGLGSDGLIRTCSLTPQGLGSDDSYGPVVWLHKV